MIRRHQAQVQPGTGTTAIQNASQALETPQLYSEEEVAAQLAEMRQKYNIGQGTNFSTGAAGGAGGTGGTGGTGTATNTSQYQTGQTRRMPTVTDLLAGTSSPAARGFQKAGIGLAQGLMNYNPDVLAAQGFDPEKFNRQTTGLGYGTAVGGFLEGIGETVASGLEGKVDAQNIKDAMYAQMAAYEEANTQTDMGRPQDPYLEDQFMQGGGYIDSFKKGGKKKKKNKPNNPALWSRAIAAAKKKFDVYPSAYANAWAVQWYKKKGGTWRKSQDGQEVQTAPPSFSEAAKKAANQTPPIKIEEELSGRHTTGIADPLNSGTPINSELEKNEFIERPTGEPITKVVGKSHSQGGEMMNLEEGTRILSDNIKIGKENKEILEPILNIKLKTDDTVAQVLDKYRKSNISGLEDLMKVQEKALSGLKENIDVEDEPTRRVNEQFYADKIIDSEQELQVKRQEERKVFELLFRMQESLKQRDEMDDPTVGNIRKRPKLEYDYIPEEGAEIPEPEEMETEEAGMEELGVYLEGGEYLSIYMDGDDILADETIRAAIQEDAMLRGYNDLDTYMQDNVTGIARAADGGIPERYKKKGFRKAGVKKRAPSGAKHKWEVLAKKKVGGKTRYKIVKGGYRGMQDFKSHKDSKRKKRFWDRMGGRNSSKAKDPFSPLYWHKRFGTWEDGGDFKFEPHMMYHPETGQAIEATTYEQHLGLGRQGYTHEPRGGRNISRNQDATGVASDQRSREIASQRAERGFRASDLDYYIDDIFIGFNDNRDEDTTISAMTNGRAENRDQLRSLVLTDGLSAVASDLGIGREEIAQLPTDALIYLIDYKLNTGKDVRDLLLRADQDITVTQLQSKKPNVQLYEDNKEDLLNKLNNFTLSYGIRPALEDAYKTLPGESGESYSVNNPNPKYTNVYGDRVNYISTARLNQAVENSDLTEGTPSTTGTTQGRTEDGLYYSGYSTSDIQKDDQGEYITTPQGDRINIITDETTGLKYYDENLAPQTYSSSSDIGAFQPARYTRQDMLPEAEEELKAEYNKFFDDLEARQAEGKDITGTFNVYGFSSPEPVNENLWSQLGNASSSEEANDFLAQQRAKTSRGIFEEIAAERGIDISGLNIVEKGISERGYAGDLEGYADYDPELKGDGYLGQRGFGFDYTATTPDSRKAYLETPPPPPPPPPDIEPDPQYQPQRGGMDFPMIDYMSRLPRPITNFMTTGLNLLPYREVPDVKLSEEAALVANSEALGNAIDVSTQNIGAQTNAALAQLTRGTSAANNQAVVETNKANAQLKQQSDIAELNSKNQIDQLNSAALYQYDVNAITAADNQIKNIMDYQNAKLKRQDEFKADLANQQLALVFGPNVRRGPFGGIEVDPSSYQDLLRYNPNNFAQNYMTSAYLSAGSGTAES